MDNRAINLRQINIRQEESSSVPPQNETRKELAEQRQDFLQYGPNVSFLFSFMTELVAGTKAFLSNLRSLAQALKPAFVDNETEECFHQLTAEIDNMDTVLDGLTNFITLNTPVKRVNTIDMIEDILKKNQSAMERKGVLLFKKLEEHLPDPTVPDEQLKYILNLTFQYALALMPQNGGLGLFTKYFGTNKGDDQASSKWERGYIEILTVFTGHRKLTDHDAPEITSFPHPKKETPNLLLRLISESVQRNHGVMKIEVDEKKKKTFISLRFPIERRQGGCNLKENI